MYVEFGQYDLTIIAIDGIYMEPRQPSILWFAITEKYDVLLTTKGSKDKNYALFSNLDQAKFATIAGYLHPNATGYLVYDDSQSLPPEASRASAYGASNHYALVPQDFQPLLLGHRLPLLF